MNHKSPILMTSLIGPDVAKFSPFH